MIGVKITVLLIMAMIVWRHVAGILFDKEDWEKRVSIAVDKEMTWYLIVYVFLVCASGAGVLYSAIYLLFLR